VSGRPPTSEPLIERSTTRRRGWHPSKQNGAIGVYRGHRQRDQDPVSPVDTHSEPRAGPLFLAHFWRTPLFRLIGPTYCKTRIGLGDSAKAILRSALCRTRTYDPLIKSQLVPRAAGMGGTSHARPAGSPRLHRMLPAPDCAKRIRSMPVPGPAKKSPLVGSWPRITLLPGDLQGLGGPQRTAARGHSHETRVACRAALGHPPVLPGPVYR